MQNDTLRLIINPVSGTESKLGVDRYIKKCLERHGWHVEICHSRYAGHATELAAEAAARGYVGALACGGDGTVNEVGRGLVGTDCALGIIPTGSGNGLARHIEIPMDIHNALKVINDRHIVGCDYGSACGLPFFCTFGIGFDAAVSTRFARKKRRGLNTYVKSVLEEFATYHSEEYVLRIGDREITDHAFLIACCNASQYGNNAFIAPDASIRDGLLDITVIHSGNKLQHTLVGFELVTGYIGRTAAVDIYRAGSATIQRPAPGPAHIDGDPVELPAEIEIVCHPGALKIFTTTAKTRFRPIITPAKRMVREWLSTANKLLRGKNTFPNL